MPFSVFIEMTLSAILTVWSPGPNSILLLSSASKYGVRGLYSLSGLADLAQASAIRSGAGEETHLET